MTHVTAVSFAQEGRWRGWVWRLCRLCRPHLCETRHKRTVMRVPSVRVSKKRLGRVLCINHYGHCRGTYTWSHLFVTVFGYRLPSLQRRISKQPWHSFAVSQTAAVGTSCSSIRSGKMPWCTDRSWARKHSSQSYRCLAIADLGAANRQNVRSTQISCVYYI